ncbi:MAG: IS30 family transposase, partial [Patescibacteria group bacterium]
MKWKNISSAERMEIGILRSRGYTIREVAKEMERSPNTISYELRKNKTRDGYSPKKAQDKSRLRKRMRRFQWMKIEENVELRKYIIAGLEKKWNPDEISGRMKLEKKPWCISKNSIYRWLYSMRGQKYCHLLYSKRYHRRKRVGSKKRTLIPNRIDISKRFLGSENRTRYGHWEKDAIVSRQGVSASVAVAQERKSRLISARKVRNMSPVDHEIAVRRMFEGKKALSITRDNGIENTRHRETLIPSFFCEPYSSWQKGGVENANKMIRGFFPKGTDFRFVTQEDIDIAIVIINNKPRKILKYKTALEVASAVGIITSIKSESVLIQGG